MSNSHRSDFVREIAVPGIFGVERAKSICPLQIPTQAGHPFRDYSGHRSDLKSVHRSDLKAAIIPI
jgi:hypothetical protein